ncbi:MAG: hypothetical protein WCB27_01625 [Thermoguttaceae bacterium]
MKTGQPFQMFQANVCHLRAVERQGFEILVAIVECEDGEPSDDVEEWAMREFGELTDAERFAEDVYSNNVDADAFTLANPPPPHNPWSGERTEQCRQKVLLTGMDCPPGQLDLFQADGEAAEPAE